MTIVLHVSSDTHTHIRLQESSALKEADINEEEKREIRT